MRALMLVAAFAMTSAAPGVAAAGTYVVEACRTPHGVAPTSMWRAMSLPSWQPPMSPLVEDACSQEGLGLRFRAEPLRAGEALGTAWVFDAPAGTSVTGLRLRRYAALAGSSNAQYGVVIGERVLEETPKYGPWAVGSTDLTGELVADGLEGTRVAVMFGCFAGSSGCPGEGFTIVIARAAVTLLDESAPQVSGPPSGALVAGGVLSGTVDLRLGHTDVGGGTDTVEVLVDGHVRSVRRVGGPACVRPYVTAAPCSLDGDVSMTLDTTELSDGLHHAEVALTDAAGNRTTLGPYPISVSNPRTPPGPVATSTQRPAATQVPGRLSVSGKRTRRVKFASQRLRGTLLRLQGGALAGALVELTTRPLRGGAWSPPTAATTDRDGRFAFTLARGPSREVRVAYGTSAQTVRLIVAAPVRLKTDPKATRNGRTVTFSGGVPGAGAARTRVELQAWTGRWVTFKTAALRNERFKASYRFTSTYQRTRYRFRAVVHESGDFPYASGKSPIVSVVVAP